MSHHVSFKCIADKDRLLRRSAPNGIAQREVDEVIRRLK